jgi:hypothetical protein
MNKILSASLRVLMLFGVYASPMETTSDYTIDPALQDQQARYLLLEGIVLGNVKTMEEAIKQGADVNALYSEEDKAYKKTALGIAIDRYFKIDSDSLKLIQLLLDNGADPNWYAQKASASDDKISTLHRITLHQINLMQHNAGEWKIRYPLFKLLYSYGADPASGSFDSNFTAYNSLLMNTYQCMEHKGQLPAKMVEDNLLIGLLALNLLDEKESCLDRAIKLSIWESEKTKQQIIRGKERHLEYLKVLGEKIKEDLEQQEEQCLKKSTMSLFQALNYAPIMTLDNAHTKRTCSSHQRGYYRFIEQHGHRNKISYHGRTYLGFKAPLQIKK